MTQIVPLLNSKLPIVAEAKKALKNDFGFVSLEGYIVGKMTLAILSNINGELTRENFMKQVQTTKLSLGGLTIDFTSNPYQGSNLVIVSQLKDEHYIPATPATWQAMMK
ncbi:hypothetical protein [Spartinivicinus poritis]|uniref:Uncharacterized protein n=1 Tax=Spartinivicinus poritis TaxID=2994640 RepID=A0ABT5UE66_9GAMM|nr:hypothetical protein [Spartinivicinus sp. A2-2]MDE1464661.1 hypothetical protein [Spartinivicinus sp. A2-2]